MYTVGTDIIEVQRIKNAIEGKGKHFLNRVFTENEIKYCNTKNVKFQHFAGRFAAKEAIKKAIMSMDATIEYIPFSELEVLNRKNGKPYLSFDEGNSFIPKSNMELSISHISKYATSTAIMEKKQ